MRRWSRKETDIFADHFYVLSKRLGAFTFLFFVGLYLIDSITNNDFELWTFLIIAVGMLCVAVGVWGLGWTVRYILLPLLRRRSGGL